MVPLREGERNADYHDELSRLSTLSRTPPYHPTPSGATRHNLALSRPIRMVLEPWPDRLPSFQCGALGDCPYFPGQQESGVRMLALTI